MDSNERLSALMHEAGFLKEDGSVGRKVFARAVSRHAGKSFTHTYVGRWLSGMVPRDPRVRQAIARALSERLGRPVSEDELGFGPGAGSKFPVDLGLRYPDSAADGTSAVSRLWDADVGHVHSLLVAPVNAGSWNDAALSWLVSTGDHLGTVAGGRTVGSADVAGLRSAVELFERLDGEHGGGHARTALVEFLRKDLAPLLRGTYTAATGRELYGAAASATMLAAWMSYDAGVHGLAQRYFIHALKFAESAGDRLQAGSILDAMSHQATYLGNYREAANLAGAALTGTAAVGSRSLTAHFHMMKARAYAKMGDAAACDREMSAAVREFERRQPENDPEWFTYFNEAELAADLGHCNRDLGRSVDASTYAAQSVGANGEQVRSDFFAAMVLADAYLDQGEAEQACEVAMRALVIGERLKSARCATYVDEFRQRLARLGTSPIAREFNDRASATRLWTPEGR